MRGCWTDRSVELTARRGMEKDEMSFDVVADWLIERVESERSGLG